jgi:hypothetical protein
MAAPTRPQIEAAVTLPTYLLEYNSGAGWVSVSADDVIEIDGTAESSAGDNGLSFGATAAQRATIQLHPSASSIAWDGTRVRVSYGFDTSDKMPRYAGVIVARNREGDTGLRWDVAGYDELIRRSAVYSPMIVRRNASTATTASSTEDPTNPAWRGGLVNYIFWTAGGRPLEQAASYPTALFFYSCDFSPIAPEWSIDTVCTFGKVGL